MKKYIIAITVATFLACVSFAQANPINNYSAYESFGFKANDFYGELNKGADHRTNSKKIQIEGFDKSHGTPRLVNLNQHSHLSIGAVKRLWIKVFSWDNDSRGPLLRGHNHRTGKNEITDRGPEKQRAPVPEPATMLLFGTGLIGIIGLRRKNIQIRS